jgi:hypothetical protein
MQLTEGKIIPHSHQGNAVFICSFSAIKPPAMPVRIKGFSFKNNTSNANMRVATNRISEQRR